MNRFYGVVGYIQQVEDPPDSDKWKEVTTTREYFGEIVKENRRWEPGDSTIDNLTVTNKIRILADDFAFQNCSAIRFVRWMGCDWKVVNAEVDHPRIVLSLGGVYNGNKARVQRDP